MRGVRVPEFLCRHLVKVRKWRGVACRIRICEKKWARDPEKASILLHFGRGRRDIPDEEGTESRTNARGRFLGIGSRRDIPDEEGTERDSTLGR